MGLRQCLRMAPGLPARERAVAVERDVAPDTCVGDVTLRVSPRTSEAQIRGLLAVRFVETGEFQGAVLVQFTCSLEMSWPRVSLRSHGVTRVFGATSRSFATAPPARERTVAGGRSGIFTTRFSAVPDVIRNLPCNTVEAPARGRGGTIGGFGSRLTRLPCSQRVRRACARAGRAWPCAGGWTAGSLPPARHRRCRKVPHRGSASSAW
ncbi:hypothetical protein CLV41_106207 [Roseibium marinum]|uniref:Uncharacterized protein n=1 Tax=Roseibium marinum TaxID=281252 RepID=A0A2S3USQ5_9HYPH|nr:hypothetical protein CLV41_106207 [Roseibium marinum]